MMAVVAKQRFHLKFRHTRFDTAHHSIVCLAAHLSLNNEKKYLQKKTYFRNMTQQFQFLFRFHNTAFNQLTKQQALLGEERNSNF